MSQKYLIRIAELERLLSEQAEALRQKDQQLSLVEETEAFLRSALTRAEEKIEEDEREIEHLRAQIEKLRRMLFGTRSEKLRREVDLAEALLKQREQDSDRYSGREDDPQVPRQLRQSRHRRPLPAHLPREIHRLEPEESCCPECAKWHLNRSQFGIRIDHDLASISDHSLASQSITIWHASDH